MRPVRSEPKKLTTPTLKTKLEKTVKSPAIPATTSHQQTDCHRAGFRHVRHVRPILGGHLLDAKKLSV